MPPVRQARCEDAGRAFSKSRGGAGAHVYVKPRLDNTSRLGGGASLSRTSKDEYRGGMAGVGSVTDLSQVPFRRVCLV